MQPKVSILIPVYNVELFLRKCMDSVVEQTLKDMEIICVNDGSTDSSLDILKSYAENDSRIIIIDKKNGGYGAAMNAATDRASGEYIGIVEPDDFVLPNMFEDLYNKAHEYDLDFVKSDFFHFSTDPDSGAIVPVMKKITSQISKYNVVFDPSKTPESIRFDMHTWTGIYKRSFIIDNNIRYNETPGASYQDNGFWFQTFVFAERAMIIDTPYYMYRIDNPNSSINNKFKVYTINAEYDYIREILTRFPDKWELFREMYWSAKYSRYISTASRISFEFKKDYIRRFSQEFKYGYKKKEFKISSFTKLERIPICLILYSPYLYYLLEIYGGRSFINKLRRCLIEKKLEKNKKICL